MTVALRSAEQGKSGSAPLIAYGFAGAINMGGIGGFLCGFIAPINSTRERTKESLLGIFITGPVGALLGFLGSILVAQIRGRKENAPANPNRPDY